MPTTVTSKIGATNSPTTMDYTTLQSWEDACPANLVTDDKIWKGECYDQGELVTATGNASLTISGMTVDATRYVWLTCAAGASFKDKAAVRSTALFYDATKGVAIRQTSTYRDVIICSASYTVFEGLQLKGTASSGGIMDGGGAIELTARNCIVTGGSSRAIRFLNGRGFIFNCLAVISAASSSNAVIVLGRTGGAGGQVIGCTIISLTGTGRGFTHDNYGTPVIKDCAFFGLNNVTNTSASAASSSNNATDLATGYGSNNQTSLTFANQFVSTTNDFRAVEAGSLDLNGTPDATNIPTDISGLTRNATTPTIGCWEVAPSVATGYPMKPLSIPPALLCM